MKGHSNFEGHRHSHSTKLQIGFSQEGHRNAKDHKWVTDKETGEEHRVKGNKPKGTRWGRRRSFSEMVNDPCWKNYKMVGMKKKGSKEVPNCVPESNDTQTGQKMKDIKEWMKETPWMKTKGDEKDKSGAVHTPMSRARNLARMALASKKKRQEVSEVRSEYSKAAHDEDGQALGIKPDSKPESNPIVKHEVVKSGGKHYISVVHKSGMSYSHKGPDGNTQNFDSKEEAEKKAAQLDKSNIGKEHVDEAVAGATHSPMSRARHLARLAMKAKNLKDSQK